MRHALSDGGERSAGSAAARASSACPRLSLASASQRSPSQSAQRGAAESRGWSASTCASASSRAPAFSIARTAVGSSTGAASAENETANMSTTRTDTPSPLLITSFRHSFSSHLRKKRRHRAAFSSQRERLLLRRLRRFRWSLRLHERKLFLDARFLAREGAQVVQLRAADIAAALHFDARDERRIGLEGPLDAFTRGDLAHDERRVETAVALGYDHTFVRLHALPLAFDHVHAHDDRVAGPELGNVLAEALDLFLL